MHNLQRNLSGENLQQIRMNYSIGSSDCYISVTQLVNRNEINACLYIPDNMELYESLLANRESIDKAADIPLKWCELPERKASKIIIECQSTFYTFYAN